MPRVARKKSESGIYHILLRGINKQIVFEDDEDYEKFLQVLKDCREKSGYQLMAYCLLENHLHLLLKEEKEALSQIFKRIGVRYVYWYNAKYQRTGHLFQDRFKSEPVDSDDYFLTVLRYIHQNPVKAGLCADVSKYRWSSYGDYLDGRGITDTAFGLSLFHEDKKTAKKLFERYMQEDEQDEQVTCLDLDRQRRITDKDAQYIILKLWGIKNSAEFQGMDRAKRDQCIAILKKNGLSLRQISRLTGISFGIVRKR